MASSLSQYPALIAEGDTVVISGGGLNKCITVRNKTQMKLGRCGNVLIGSLIGKRYGDVFAFEEKSRCLMPTLETPELDRSEIQADHVLEEAKDNRELFDTHGANQGLTQDAILTLKDQVGVENVVQTLVENSATFASKTAFAQEKYVRKKKGKYIVKFKVERVNPDNLCETIMPTLLIEADEEDDGKRRLPLRVDTLGLVLHHANVSGDMRVMVHDRTNGLLPAGILYRLGAEGQLLGIYDKTSMPSTSFARAMHIPEWKARWKAIPASPQLFSDDVVCTAASTSEPAAAGGEDGSKDAAAGKPRWGYSNDKEDRGPSQWIRASDARKQLAENPADALVIAGFEDEVVVVVRKLFPFLSLSGNLVVYCPFIEPLERIYAMIRDEAVCISISDTWYRHQQVLPGRTHPQVNMSTGGGFILTAIKVEHANPLSPVSSPTAVTVGTLLGEKRERDEAEQPSRADAEAAN